MALAKNLKVMDSTAIALARDNRLPIVVFRSTRRTGLSESSEARDDSPLLNPAEAETGEEKMQMSDEEIDLGALEKRMDGALNALRTEFASLRTGRASASMLDPVTVEAYGSPMLINQLGTVTVPEPRMVLINVWDKALVNAVDRAIRNSGLGINPQMDGTILRLPIPELNEERRRDLAKVAGQYAEHARVAVRNVRRDGMDQIKKAKAAGMAEDDQKFWHDAIQETTDAAIGKIDAALSAKQEEIMQI